MMSFLSGTDHFRLRLRERAIAAQFGRAHPASEERIFDGRDTDDRFLSNLRESLSGGLFAEPRALLVRHVELFDDRTCDVLIGLLKEPAADDVLIVASAELSSRSKKGNALQAWLAKNVETEEVNMLAGRAVGQSVLDTLQGIDPAARIDPRAAELLGLWTAGATGRIYHDLLKLTLAMEGRTIMITDVQQFVEEPAGESVSFALLEQIVRGNRERAISLLRQEETNDDAVFKLLGLFAWQVRQGLMVRDEYDRGESSPERIAATIGAKPFSVKKLMPLISKLSINRLKRSLRYLSDLDRGMKTGQIRPGVALDLFVWKF